jgi:hypothetical protein
VWQRELPQTDITCAMRWSREERGEREERSLGEGTSRGDESLHGSCGGAEEERDILGHVIIGPR